MAFDGRKYQVQPEEITLTGRGGRVFTYHVAPPTSEAGRVLQARLTVGQIAALAAGEPCPTCGQARELDIPEDMAELLEGWKSVTNATLALGEDVDRAMDEDGIAGPDKELVTMYAATLWTFGRAAAIGYVETVAGTLREEEPAPKG